jgi:hypothetical protein
MSIYVYIWLCIDNEEEVSVEEQETASPTEGKPRCIYLFLVILNSLSLE